MSPPPFEPDPVPATNGPAANGMARTIHARTAAAAHTKALATSLAPLLRPGDVVVLAGDLGTGKTTFVQGVAAGLGVEEVVTSPTFTLVRQYGCGSRSPIRQLLHADLYRLEDLRQVVDLDLHELVEDGAAALVEWGDMGAPVLGPECLEVRLARWGGEDGGEDDRTVAVTVPASPSWSDRSPLVAEGLRPWRTAEP